MASIINLDFSLHTFYSNRYYEISFDRYMIPSFSKKLFLVQLQIWICLCWVKMWNMIFFKGKQYQKVHAHLSFFFFFLFISNNIQREKHLETKHIAILMISTAEKSLKIKHVKWDNCFIIKIHWYGIWYNFIFFYRNYLYSKE